MIVRFKWWLSNTVSIALKTLSESLFKAMEKKIHAVFKAARIGWATDTALEIFWNDTNIRPRIEARLKRSFLRQYNTFLRVAGTAQSDELLRSFFNLEYVYSIDMRDHPHASHLYPYHVVRIWIPPVNAALKRDIRYMLSIILPARCVKHYQLLTWHDTSGFGRTQFGRVFGR